MTIHYDQHFLRQVKDLPKAQKNKLARLLMMLEQDPHDPRLHTKKLGPPLEGQYSFRITRDWRVVFRYAGFDALFVTRVEHRKDVYN